MLLFSDAMPTSTYVNGTTRHSSRTYLASLLASETPEHTDEGRYEYSDGHSARHYKEQHPEPVERCPEPVCCSVTPRVPLSCHDHPKVSPHARTTAAGIPKTAPTNTSQKWRAMRVLRRFIPLSAAQKYSDECAQADHDRHRNQHNKTYRALPCDPFPDNTHQLTASVAMRSTKADRPIREPKMTGKTVPSRNGLFMLAPLRSSRVAWFV